MYKKHLLLFMLIAIANTVVAETTTVISIGPSARVQIESNGRSVSATAAASQIIIEGDEGAEVDVEIINEGDVSVSAIVISDDSEDEDFEIEDIDDEDVSISIEFDDDDDFFDD